MDERTTEDPQHDAVGTEPLFDEFGRPRSLARPSHPSRGRAIDATDRTRRRIQELSAEHRALIASLDGECSIEFERRRKTAADRARRRRDDAIRSERVHHAHMRRTLSVVR